MRLNLFTVMAGVASILAYQEVDAIALMADATNLGTTLSQNANNLI